MRGQKRWSTNWPPAALPPGGGRWWFVYCLDDWMDEWWMMVRWISIQNLLGFWQTSLALWLYATKNFKVIIHSFWSSSTNLDKSSSYISPLWFAKPNSPEQQMLLFTTCFFRTEQAELFFLPGKMYNTFFLLNNQPMVAGFSKWMGKKNRISHQTVSSKFMFFHFFHLQNVGTTTSLQHNAWTFPHWLRLPNISRCPRCPTCPTWRCDHWRKTRWTPPRCGSLHGCRRPGNKLNLYTSSKSNNCNKSIEHIHLLQNKVTNKSTGIYILLQKSAWQW